MGDWMVASVTDVPHFAFPFRWNPRGHAAVVEQGSYEEIRQGLEVLVLTDVGERLEVPEFGIPDPAFQQDVDVQGIQSAALNWDERADVIFEGADYDEMSKHLLTYVANREK